MKRALCIVCALTGVAGADVSERSRVEVKPAAKAFKQLSVENALGNVRIEGHDGNSIMIETIKRAPDEDALDRLRVSLVPDPDGTVHIVTAADAGKEARPVPRSAVSIDIVIRAPRNARIDAAVGSGKLEVIDMDGGGDLDTASGAISVRNVTGELYTHSVSGPMSITQAFGSIDAATVSSDVELDTIGGRRLVASANQGRIAGRRVRARDIELTTTTGRIQLEAEAALRGRIMVASLRGDVDVKVRRQMNAALLVRGRGTKVDLGSAAAMLGDWSEVKMGSNSDPAVVELRSTFGRVRFSVIQ